MEYLNKLLEKKNRGQLILTILLIIYLILGTKVPPELANILNNPISKVLLALCAFILFIYSNPILGVIGILVAFEMIRHASNTTKKPNKVDYIKINTELV
jgi:type II secretory pathway component PulF